MRLASNRTAMLQLLRCARHWPFPTDLHLPISPEHESYDVGIGRQIRQGLLKLIPGLSHTHPLSSSPGSAALESLGSQPLSHSKGRCAMQDPHHGCATSPKRDWRMNSMRWQATSVRREGAAGSRGWSGKRGLDRGSLQAYQRRRP